MWYLIVSIPDLCTLTYFNQNIIMLHIKLKGIMRCSNMVANSCLKTPPLTLGSNNQNSTFSKQCHVAYYIKGNLECSNMIANILSAAPHPRPWVLGQNVKILLYNVPEQYHVAYQVKETQRCSNMVANIFPAAPGHPPRNH